MRCEEGTFRERSQSDNAQPPPAPAGALRSKLAEQTAYAAVTPVPIGQETPVPPRPQ